MNTQLQDAWIEMREAEGDFVDRPSHLDLEEVFRSLQRVKRVAGTSAAGAIASMKEGFYERFRERTDPTPTEQDWAEYPEVN